MMNALNKVAIGIVIASIFLVGMDYLFKTPKDRAFEECVTQLRKQRIPAKEADRECRKRCALKDLPGCY
jgi:hypothetical protein